MPHGTSVGVGCGQRAHRLEVPGHNLAAQASGEEAWGCAAVGGAPGERRERRALTARHAQQAAPLGGDVVELDGAVIAAQRDGGAVRRRRKRYHRRGRPFYEARTVPRQRNAQRDGASKFRSFLESSRRASCRSYDRPVRTLWTTTPPKFSPVCAMALSAVSASSFTGVRVQSAAPRRVNPVVSKGCVPMDR